VAVATSHVCGAGKWLDDGIVPVRNGTGLFASVPSGAYRCRDGLVYLMVNRPLHWKALAEWIHEETGNREVLDPMFEGPSSNRLPYRELLDLFIGELVARHGVEHVYREGQRRHIAFTPVNGALQVARDAHLADRGFFVDVPHAGVGSVRMPGAPYRHARTPWRVARPAPGVGEHDEEVFAELRAGAAAEPPAPGDPAPGAEPVQALRGVKVLEFTSGMAGPWIGRFMAHCGAEVIKVESAQHPSVVRLYVPPGRPELGTQPELSPWFTDWDAGKRFVALDLRKPEGVALARRLAAWADVVVENHSAGVMERLGLGYADLRRANPALVYFGTSGYGDTGPDRSFVTWGPNIEALSGLSTLSGFAERPCTITQYAYPDALSALHGLVAVMAALDHRARSGDGQCINLSQLEATVACIGPLLMEALDSGREPRKLANASRVDAPHGIYPCRGDDRWCALAVDGDDAWQRLGAVAGRPAWATDPRFASRAGRLAHAAELDGLVAAWSAAHAAPALAAELQAAGIAAAAVQDVADLVERDPQLAARGFFETLEHRRKGPVVATGIPLGLTGTPGRTPFAGGAIGEDNEAVFCGTLGLAREEYEARVAAGVIESPSRAR
jgi:crotonobetainyl-CoA:carnitine CoA-transferase CaiB-like acyl-CoA transferase